MKTAWINQPQRAWRVLGVLGVLGIAVVVGCTPEGRNYNDTSTSGSASSTGGMGGMGGAGMPNGGSGGEGGVVVMCTPGEVKACYTGPLTTSNVGNCKTGNMRCNDNGMGFGPCEGEVLPASGEDCTKPGDEDCNGLAEDPAICICSPGTQVSCNVPGLLGACALGTGTCAADGRTIENCNQITFPAFDDCRTAQDDDCNGTAVDACTGTPTWAFTPAGANAGTFDDAIFDVAATSDGGYVVVGMADGTIPPVGGTKFQSPLNEPSAGSAYVAKINANGALEWVRKFLSTGFAAARGIAIDPQGNIIVVGDFQGDLNVGSGPVTSAWTDMFILKLDGMGNPLWSKIFGASGRDYAYDVAIDAQGNIFVTGSVESGPVTLGGDTFTPAVVDLFLASYDGAGNHRWSKVFVNPGAAQESYAIAMTADGNPVVFIAKGPGNGASFGGTSFPATNDTDAVVALYNGTTGNHLWSTWITGPVGNQVPYDIAVAPNGNILIAGYFDFSIKFGVTTLTPIGDTNVFVAELNALSGVPIRSKRIGGAGITAGAFGIAADGAGNIILAGQFVDGPMDFEGSMLPTPLAANGFAAKLSATDWSPLWVRAIGSNGDQFAHTVAVDSTGNAVVAGCFYTEADFGAPLAKVLSTGGADMYAVRLAP